MAWRSAVVVALVLAFGCLSFAEQDYGYLPADLESDLSLRNLYENWIVKHGHSFSEEEKEKRFVTFKSNVLKIDSYNQKDLSYKLAVNKFAHLTREEFKSRYLGYKKRGSLKLPSLKKSRSLNVTLKTTDLPDSIDWRELGAVTEVKDQSVCGSCWAFSAIGSIEGANAIYTGELVSLSEQELVDCDTFDEGCNGGLMDYAFEFVIENGGIDTEADYPYTGVDGYCDSTKLNSRVVSIDSYVDVTPNSESALQAAVATQPVSVAVEADEFAFEYYSSGILTGSCGTDLDHGVLAVGYGTSSDGVDYWIVKNSWGTSWGDNGYIYLERNVDSPFGMCGIAIEPSYPVKTSANPSPAPSSEYPPPPPVPSPPSPDVEPVECDKNSYCPAETTCCCVFNIGFWCLSWGCCSYPNAVCCSDHVHCCPSDYPVCNIFDGYCSQSDSSDSNIKSVPALKQLPAKKHPYSTWPLRQSVLGSKLDMDADEFTKQIEQEKGSN